MIPDRYRGILYSWGIRPTGAGRGFPAAGGDGGYPAASRGRRRAVPACLGMHPPFSFLLAWRKENGPCTVQKKRDAFGGCGSLLPLLKVREKSPRGRMDVLLFPRFAPGRLRVGERGAAAFYEGAPSKAIPLRGRWRGRPPFNSRLCLLIRQGGHGRPADPG